MKQPVDRELYREVVEAARRETDRGIDPEEVRRVERNVRRTLTGKQRAPERRWRWWAPAVAAAVAAVAAVVMLPRESERAPAPPAASARAPTTHTVVYLHGAVERLRARQLAPEESLQLAVGGRLDLSSPEGRVSVRGPARVVTDPRGRLQLTDGTATLEVPKRAEHEPVLVGCGQTEVVVVGTTFTVRATAGECDSVRVEEGRVTVRRAPPVELGPGQAYFRSATSELTGDLEPPFGAPWWSETGDEPSGYLAVQSEPDGASVRLDGHALGSTPLLVRWRAGEARLAVKSPGFRRWDGTVTIRAAELTQAHARLKAKKEEPEPTPDRWDEARALLAAARCERLQAVTRTLIAAAETDVERARVELLPAECALRLGRRQRALALYRSLVDRYPSTPSAEAARFETARLQFELGRFPAALASVEAYLAEHPEGRFAQAAEVRRCEILVELGKIETAVTCLTGYRSEHPGGVRHFQATLLLATLERRRGAWQRAADLYRELAERAPSSPQAEEVLYRRAQSLAWGRLPGASAAAREYVERFPRGAHVDEVRGWVEKGTP